MKKNTNSLIPAKGGMALQDAKDTNQGLLMRLGAAIMEGRYESLETIYNENVEKKGVDKRIICLCVLGMMHVINATPINKRKPVIETAQRFKLHKEDILNNVEIKKLDNKKYFVYPFSAIIEVFLKNSLGGILTEELAKKKQALLSLVSTGGIGRGYRFDLCENLPGLMKCVQEIEEFIALLYELPIENAEQKTLELAKTFLDEGKIQILIEEKFFQPSAPSVSTTAIWHNYVFLRDELFVHNTLLTNTVVECLNRRSKAWLRIQRYLINLWFSEKRNWYLADLRRKFPKERMLQVVADVDALLLAEPSASLRAIEACIAKGLAKKKK